VGYAPLNEQAAKAITGKILPISSLISCWRVTWSAKKPDPEIYNLALSQTGLKPDEVIVVEDSKNGVLAGKAANAHVIVTTNYYTEKEDVTSGDIIVTCLGDPDGEKGKLTKGGESLKYDGVLHIGQVVDYFSK
jgi:beta-phosphoglucomutase-like phosphatase (HAD superfamily)